MIQVQLIVASVIAFVAFTAGFGIATQRKNVELGEVRAAFEKHRTAAIENTARWEAQQRIEEGRRIKTIMEITDAAHLQAAQARADAQRLDRVAGVLRAAVVAAYPAGATSAGSNPTVASGSTPATGAGLVLPDLFGRVDARLRELAAAYDQARIAGLTCERSYGALTNSASHRPAE